MGKVKTVISHDVLSDGSEVTVWTARPLCETLQSFADSIAQAKANGQVYCATKPEVANA